MGHLNTHINILVPPPSSSGYLFSAANSTFYIFVSHCQRGSHAVATVMTHLMTHQITICCLKPILISLCRRQANKGTSPDMWTRAWVSRYWPSDPIPLFLFRFSISFIFQKNTLLFVSFTFLYSSNITKTAKITNRELNKKNMTHNDSFIRRTH